MKRRLILILPCLAATAGLQIAAPGVALGDTPPGQASTTKLAIQIEVGRVVANRPMRLDGATREPDSGGSKPRANRPMRLEPEAPPRHEPPGPPKLGGVTVEPGGDTPPEPTEPPKPAAAEQRQLDYDRKVNECAGPPPDLRNKPTLTPEDMLKIWQDYLKKRSDCEQAVRRTQPPPTSRPTP